MRAGLFAAILAASWLVASPAFADAQNSEVVTVGSDKFLRWFAHAGRTYFIQVSDPNDHLKKWTWAPIIETGNDEDISYEVDGTADKGFYRLWFSDQPTTDPDGDDFDYDGLTNWDEVNTHQTNPLEWDTDGDGLSDDWELANYLDPNDDGSTDPANGANGDPDNDGLTNEYEYWYWADPNLPDTDWDGLSDYAEVITHGTNPWNPDTDEDTLYDGDEVLTHGTNPLEMDTDGDWMWDDWELANNFDPTDAADGLLDADSDTLANQLEFVFMDQGFDPFIANNAVAFPWMGDPDWDGINTQVEFVTHLTNPRQPDTDDDGMGDGWELQFGFNAKLHNSQDTNPNNDEDSDPDDDNLTNGEESNYGTNPNDPDTDGDGVNDDVEINQGTNPNDPNDHDPPQQGTMAVSVEFGDPSGSHSEKYRVRLQPVEGDNQVHERTNRKYGQTQTDTFHLPKGAKYNVTLVHVGTSPKYRDDPKPDYDYDLSFSTSNADDRAALVTDDPQGILGGHNEGEQFFAEGKTASLFTALITSETTATLPTDRMRIKLGVTETVELTLHPSSLPNPTWQITGNKHLSTLNPTTGITSTMTVEFDACQPVAEATINGQVVKIEFDVVEPDGIVMRQQPGTGIEHTQGIPSAGFTGNPYITPNDVSFASGRLQVREQTCIGVGTGYYAYQNGDVHLLGPFRTVIEGDATNPSKVDTSDHIYSGNTGPATPAVGAFDWVIPMEFRVMGWNTKQFTTITHHHESDAAGTVSITKGAGPFSAQLNDPTYP